MQCIQIIPFLIVFVFPGNWTHNLLRCYRIALTLCNRNYLWGVLKWGVVGRRGWVLTFRKKTYLWVWDFNLCNFTDRVYARTACNTPKTKENMKSCHMTSLRSKYFRGKVAYLELFTDGTLLTCIFLMKQPVRKQLAFPFHIRTNRHL